MSAEASPQAAAPGENAASEKESKRKERWETLVEIVVRAMRVTTTAIALALAAYTVAEMLTLLRI